MSESIVINCDCMEYMRTLPDKAFDLAVVDPPYGDGKADSMKRFDEMYKAIYGTETRSHIGNVERENPPQYNRFGGRFDRYKSCPNGRRLDEKVREKIIVWDNAPKEEYFAELFRVSRNQIIWGGNYFYLPPTRCFLIWRKTNIPLEGFSMAPVEYAWTSFNRNAEMCEVSSAGGNGKGARFHPTQKPVALYTWLFKRYAKRGDRILDTHLGSGSSRIAAYDLGLDFAGCELDQTYFKLQEERFNEYAAQQSLFILDGEN